jgi:hypothetical protein
MAGSVALFLQHTIGNRHERDINNSGICQDSKLKGNQGRCPMRTNHTVELPPPVEDPHARLEMMYIVEYLKSKNYQLAELAALPDKEVKQLMEEASSYASLKLTAVETGASFVDALHADDVMLVTNLLERHNEQGE